MMIPSDLLAGKKILLAITGSIAAYKTIELLRLYTKAGASVRIVMSQGAQRFITKLTLEALSHHAVLDESSESWTSDLNHIHLTQWADVMVIAPATANTLAKVANGIADTLVTQCALAYPHTKIIAPSANTHMLANPMIQASIKMLALANYTFVETQTKELACQVRGDGAMAEPMEIFFESARAVLKEAFWEDRRIVLTGGGTRQKIDEVRYISNFSSGKMARALALALHLKGADVCYITTTGSQELPKNLYTIDVEDAHEMLHYTQDALRVAKKGKMSKPSLSSSDAMRLIQKRPYLFMVAAVADFTPKFPQYGKLKKSTLGDQWNLELIQTQDILSTLDKEGITTIAFKAEMDGAEGFNHAKALLTTKQVDAVCYNLLRDATSFGGEENTITLITPDHHVDLGRQSKFALAMRILQEAQSL